MITNEGHLADRHRIVLGEDFAIHGFQILVQARAIGVMLETRLVQCIRLNNIAIWITWHFADEVDDLEESVY